MKGVYPKLGDGWSINPWKDPWIPWLNGKTINQKNNDGLMDIRRVRELRLQDHTLWNENLLNEVCEENMVEEVKKIDWPQLECADKLLWMASKNGIFTVKSCYSLLREYPNPKDRWILLWKSKLHERFKILIWRALSDILPTMTVLGSMLGKRGEFMQSLQDSRRNIFTFVY